MEMEQAWFKDYSTAAYVDLDIGNTSEYEEYTQRCAEWLKWKYDRLEGEPRLFKELLSGRWDDDSFLVVEPGNKIEATNDEHIMTSVPADRAD